MSRKYSVLFVALALVVAMAASAWALSIPSYSGGNQSAVPNQTKIDILGVSLDYSSRDAGMSYAAQPLWWSGDVQFPAGGLYVRPRVRHLMPRSADAFSFALSGDATVAVWNRPPGLTIVSYDEAPNSSYRVSADAVLMYLGRGVRDFPVVFSADTLMGAANKAFSGSATFQADRGMTFGSSMNSQRPFLTSPDAAAGAWNPVSSDTLNLWDTVCAQGDCWTFYRDVLRVWSGDNTANPSTAWRLVSSDLSMFFYMPCDKFVKDWQVYNRLPYEVVNNAVVSSADGRLRTVTLYDNVFPQDMVRFSNAVTSDHDLVLGPYVVEKYRDAANDPLRTRNPGDVIVERILNLSAASVSADIRVLPSGQTFFNWLPLGPRAYSRDAYAQMDTDIRGGALHLDTAYLQFEEWNTSRTDSTSGYTWYTWMNTTDPTLTTYRDASGFTVGVGQNVDLAPGFARYYVYSADETNTIEMCFTEQGVAGGERFCQETTIDPQIWVKDGCILGDDYDWSDCFGAVTMSADNDVRGDLATRTGMTAPVFTTESTSCGNCAGQIRMRTAVNTLLEPFASLNACEGSTVCLGASLDVTLTGNPSCSYSLEDLHLVRVTFRLAPQRICDETARTNVAAAVAALGADPFNKPENVAPADAFLNPASVDATLGAGLDIVAILPDGSKANLVELAKQNEFLDATQGYQGIKNYFEAWAQPNMSVWEAWSHATVANREVFLSFHVAIVNGDAPEDQDAIQAMPGYFLIYAGDANESLANQVPGYNTYFALMSGFDPNCGAATPTPTPAPVLTVTADPAITTSAVVECATDFEKALFTEAAWTEILSALGITAANEANYTFSYTGSACEEDTVAGLTAGQDVTFTLSYDDGLAAAATTAKVPFVYNTSEAKYDVIAAASETSIATAQTKVWTIAEGSVYDQEVNVAGELKVGFHLVAVTATPVTTPTTAPSSGGGSGCSFGFAPLALLLLAPLALLRK